MAWDELGGGALIRIYERGQIQFAVLAAFQVKQIISYVLLEFYEWVNILSG